MMSSSNFKKIELPTPIAVYSYYFDESTGLTNQILYRGEKVSIRFVAPAKWGHVHRALAALKWNVLYPNSEGQITLYGKYDPEASTFELFHWKLPAPFEAYEYSKTEMPASATLISRPFLVKSDFGSTLEDNPKIYHKTFDNAYRE